MMQKETPDILKVHVKKNDVIIQLKQQIIADVQIIEAETELQIRHYVAGIHGKGEAHDSDQYIIR